jgi:hypothetical protein
MAQATSRETGRPLIANLRVTAAERAQIHKVAAQRGVSASDLIRQALRREGALPPQ